MEGPDCWKLSLGMMSKDVERYTANVVRSRSRNGRILFRFSRQYTGIIWL